MDVARGNIGRGAPMEVATVISWVAARPIAATVNTGAIVRQGATSQSGEANAAGRQTARATACPGLFRIVPALDGGICRIKLTRGQLSSAQMRALAGLATIHAGGAVEITNRANLQIRAVRPGAEAALIQGLREAGLGAANPGADDVRNVMVSPLAGDDPTSILDVTMLADAVLTRLQAEPRYHVLSPKFSLQIDGGEAIAMTEHPNDIWLSAVDAGTYAFGFAGCPPVTAQDRAAGFVAAADALDFIFACLDRFIAFNGQRTSSGEEISRLRHLLKVEPAEDFLRPLQVDIRSDKQTTAWHRRRPQPFAHIGAIPLRDGKVALGAVPPLGRVDANELKRLADLADTFAGGALRLTPWQSVMLLALAASESAKVLSELETLGFVASQDRALGAIIACTGSQGCASGQADTKSDALDLARRLDAVGFSPFGVHLSGCSKSCAAPRPAQATLVGAAEGRYDIFWHDGANTGKFGTAIGAGWTIEQAAGWLAAQSTRNKG